MRMEGEGAELKDGAKVTPRRTSKSSKTLFVPRDRYLHHHRDHKHQPHSASADHYLGCRHRHRHSPHDRRHGRCHHSHRRSGHSCHTRRSRASFRAPCCASACCYSSLSSGSEWSEASLQDSPHPEEGSEQSDGAASTVSDGNNDGLRLPSVHAGSRLGSRSVKTRRDKQQSHKRGTDSSCELRGGLTLYPLAAGPKSSQTTPRVMKSPRRVENVRRTGQSATMDKRARGVKAEAAKVLQRAFRSFAEVRKHQVRNETEQRKATLARKVMEELLDEYLIDESIPDLLIEVIVNDFQSLPPEERVLHNSADAIVTEVVRFLAKKAAEGAVADFITSFLRRRKPRDTLRLLSDDVVHDTVEALARDAVEAAILECTCAYLLDRRVEKAWDEISTETVRALVVEVADRVYEDETAAEWSVHQLLAEVSADLFEPIVDQAWLELELQKIRVVAIVTWHAIVDRAMAEVLDHMYPRGQTTMLQDTTVLLIAAVDEVSSAPQYPPYSRVIVL